MAGAAWASAAGAAAVPRQRDNVSVRIPRNMSNPPLLMCDVVVCGLFCRFLRADARQIANATEHAMPAAQHAARRMQGRTGWLGTDAIKPIVEGRLRLPPRALV